MRPGPAQLWPDVAPSWILGLPQWLEEFFYDFYKSFIFDDRYMLYVEGLGNTLLLTAMALLMGTSPAEAGTGLQLGVQPRRWALGTGGHCCLPDPSRDWNREQSLVWVSRAEPGRAAS